MQRRLREERRDCSSRGLGSYSNAEATARWLELIFTAANHPERGPVSVTADQLHSEAGSTPIPRLLKFNPFWMNTIQRNDREFVKQLKPKLPVDPKWTNQLLFSNEPIHGAVRFNSVLQGSGSGTTSSDDDLMG